MTHRIAFFLALVVSPLVAFGGDDAPSADKANARKPNVLFILTDDQGSIDVNCYGAKDLVTPNMDALARDGVRFEQFYAASAICSPSRAAIMTGKYPQRAGLATNAGRGHGMPGSQVTMAEVFKAAGYATGHVGKWHMSDAPNQWPNAQGFDSSFGFLGGCIDNFSHFFYWDGPNRHDLMHDGQEVWRAGQFFGDLMVDACEKYLDEHKEEPFFLYWAINMPHYPLQPTEKWRKHYADLPSPRDKYAAFVSTTDELIGRVLAKLDSLGLADNTIVVFMSDHGHSYEERTFFGGGSSGPYRGGKFSLFEGGIRVPAIVRWPAGLPKGEIREQLATGCDWLPTLAELCGIELSAKFAADLDGRSIASVLRSAEAPSPHDVVHWMMGKQWAVREGNWKLLGNPNDPSRKAPIGRNDSLFLVNLARDKTEMSNLAGAHPKVVERLHQLHLAWAAQVEAEAPPAAAANTEKKEEKRWADVVEWTHSWDLRDAVTYEDDGKGWSIPAATRVDRIPDGGAAEKKYPLKRDDGGWSGAFKIARIPGPLLVKESKRFNGRPAMLNDRVGPGLFGHTFSGLATAADPRDKSQWFNPPHGYDAPYWGAVLCRPPKAYEDVFGAWDAYNGHIGTTATMAKGVFPRNGKGVWGMTTSLGLGDPWPSTNVPGDHRQSVLVVGYVDGENSFMEITWRDADGKIQTDRTNFKLTSHTAKEIFVGLGHTSYFTAAGMKLGKADEKDLAALREWSAQWLPPTGELPMEP